MAKIPKDVLKELRLTHLELLTYHAASVQIERLEQKMDEVVNRFNSLLHWLSEVEK